MWPCLSRTLNSAIQLGNSLLEIPHSPRGFEYYPPSVTEHYHERLRRRAADVEFHLIDGGHQMPSSGSRIVEPWPRRILK